MRSRGVGDDVPVPAWHGEELAKRLAAPTDGKRLTWADVLRRVRRRPTHPGAILREDYLPEYGLTTTTLAEALGVSRRRVHELVRERRGMSVEMALRLARLFRTTPQYWMALQHHVDLWNARNARPKRKRR